MRLVKKITPCLWFDDQAEAAANTYIGVFPNSRITQIERYGEVGHEYHGKPAGSVMTVAFELDGQPFTAQKATAAMFQMKKLDIAALQRAFDS